MKKNISILWLKIACIITFIVGLIVFAASTPRGSSVWLLLFDLLKWPLDGYPDSFSKEAFAVNAVLGGVMTGWAVLMFLLVSGPLSQGNRDTARYLIISVTTWFVIDCCGSLLADLPGNLILNTVFLLLFLPPLIFLGKNRVEKK